MDRKAARRRYKEADALYRRRDYAGALAILDEIDESLPPMKSLLFVRALCLARLRRKTEAIEACRKLSTLFDDPRADELRTRLEAPSLSRRKAKTADIWKTVDEAKATDVAEQERLASVEAPATEPPRLPSTPAALEDIPEARAIEEPDAREETHPHDTGVSDEGDEEPITPPEPPETPEPPVEEPPVEEPLTDASEQETQEEEDEDIPYLLAMPDGEEPDASVEVQPQDTGASDAGDEEPITPPEPPVEEPPAEEPPADASEQETQEREDEAPSDGHDETDETPEAPTAAPEERRHAVKLVAGALVVVALIATAAAVLLRDDARDLVTTTVQQEDPASTGPRATAPAEGKTPTQPGQPQEPEVPAPKPEGPKEAVAPPIDSAGEAPTVDATRQDAQPESEVATFKEAEPVTDTPAPTTDASPVKEEVRSPEAALAPGATWLMTGEVKIQSTVVSAQGEPPKREESGFFVRIATTVTGNDGTTLELTHQVDKYPVGARSWSEEDYAREEPLTTEAVDQVFALDSEEKGLAARESALLRPMVAEFFFPLLTPSDSSERPTLRMDAPMRNPMITGGFDWPGELKLTVDDLDDDAVHVAYAHTVPLQNLKGSEVSFEAKHSGKVTLDRASRQEISRTGSQHMRVSAPGQTSREELVEFTLTRGTP